MARTPSLTPAQAAALLGPPVDSFRVDKSNRATARKFAVATGMPSVEAAAASNEKLRLHYIAHVWDTPSDSRSAMQPAKAQEAKMSDVDQSLFDICGDDLIFDRYAVGKITIPESSLRARVENALQLAFEDGLSEKEHVKAIDELENEIRSEYAGCLSEKEARDLELNRDMWEDKYNTLFTDFEKVRADLIAENQQLEKERKKWETAFFDLHADSEKTRAQLAQELWEQEKELKRLREAVKVVDYLIHRNLS